MHHHHYYISSAFPVYSKGCCTVFHHYTYGTVNTRLFYGTVIAHASFVGFVPGVAGAGTHLIGDVMSQSTVGGMDMGRGMYIKTYQRRRGRRKGSS